MENKKKKTIIVSDPLFLRFMGVKVSLTVPRRWNGAACSDDAMEALLDTYEKQITKTKKEDEKETC